MNKQTVTINGDNFTDLESFYDEIDRVLTKNLDWQTGHNLDAFNDLLRGGFGVYEYEEPIILKWNRSNESRNKLGWDETIKYVTDKLKTCHPSNVESVKADLELTKQRKGQTLFELIVDIIKSHEHITLELT